MSGYRDGYNFAKWQAGNMKKRPRRAWVRWGIACGLALVLATPVWEMIAPGNPSRPLPDMIPLALPLIFAAASSPFTRDAWLTRRGFAVYDEFEQAALHDALRHAYLVDLLAVAGVFAWLAAAAWQGWPMPQLARQWSAIGVALLILMLALPAMLAEFMVPMPDPEDETL